eukprot:CAMPEP_0171266220 /NCGR_PEP_ID=MMETSP0790-20130122/58529_1 /TAXON_ID=2925 /ORGANISM="Alexandrium catenella, Strain OF101" /LENGTH=33 /DNA_ID= /DNA_START= /DNA_END= /DNA_ORIENTATION=
MAVFPDASASCCDGALALSSGHLAKSMLLGWLH